MQPSYRLYLQEIINYLNDIVIKFEPMVELLNNHPIYFNSYDPDDPTTFPYYRILTGDASLATEELVGWVPSLQEDRPLDIANLEDYPDMRTFYAQSDNLKSLLARYPNDQFLIRRILNPVRDIDEAINSKNLTLLTTKWPSQALNSHEHADLTQFLRAFLEKFEYRWYINVFEYEDLYPYAYWAMLWYILPVALNMRRIMNIRTNQIHPYHLWEHLTSVGYGSYRGYLSRRQELFLYRNFDYLRYNVGKKFMLDILETEFLRPIKYSLSEKMIVCHTSDRESTYDKIPEIVPRTGKRPDYQSSVNFEYFLREINRNQLDPQAGVAYLSDISESFKKAPTNELNTKFIEMLRNIDNSELMVLIRFILDSVAFLHSNNQLAYQVIVNSPISGHTLHFGSVVDALNLFYYCVHHADPPTNTPVRYSSVSAITTRVPPPIPDYTPVNGRLYATKSYVDADSIINSVPYITEVMFSATELSEALGEQFAWVFDRLIRLRGISGTIEHEAHMTVYKQLIPDEHILPVHQVHQTYQEYFEAYPDSYLMLQAISDPSDYVDIMLAIFEAVCPLAYGFESLASDDEAVSITVHKIREIFTHLTSYNVAFITPIADTRDEFEIPKLTAHIDPTETAEELGAPDWARNSFDYIINMSGTIDDEHLLELEPILSITDSTLYDEAITEGDSFDKDIIDRSDISHTSFFVDSGITATVMSIDSEP